MTIDPREWEALHDAARKSLATFTRLAWPELNRGTTLHWNWHNQAICEHLEAVTRGEIKKLIINVPPGMSKTTHVCQTWPVWEWLQSPHKRWGFAAYGSTLTVRDSVKRRDLIQSRWYQDAFAPEWKLKGDTSLKTEFANTETGEMRATSIGGPVTGFHFDVLVVDDPIKAEEIYTVALKNHVDWFNGTWSSRRRDKQDSAMVIIMQRLHDRDLAGVKLREGGWEHLCLPMEYDPKRRCVTSIGWEDPRTVEGEPLCPERVKPETIVDEKRRPAIWSAQYQQSPRVGDGTCFKEAWMIYYYLDKPIDGAVPYPGDDVMDKWVSSWDLTFDAGKDNDNNSGGIWARKGPNAYLRDRSNAQMRFTQQRRTVLRMAQKWPEVCRHLVEKKANGDAVLDTLRRPMAPHEARTPEDSVGLPGLVPIEPRGSKATRAEAAATYFETGNVFLPHPDIAPWVGEYINELCAFPTGDHDDDVDMTSMALLDLMRTSAVTAQDLDAILPGAPRVPATEDLPDNLIDPRRYDKADEAFREALAEERQKEREREKIAARIGLELMPGERFSTRTGR